MTGWTNAAVVAGATVSVMIYMHTTFATASDMQDLKQTMVTNNIQEAMWTECERPNPARRKQIELDRVRYEQEFDQALPWVCSTE